MTQFNHRYENVIKNELEKKERLSFNELWKNTGIPHSTYASTIKKMLNSKQIDSEIKRNEKGRIIVEYFLTENTRLNRLWGIYENIKTNREAKKSHESLADSLYKQKAYLLITYLAAFGLDYYETTSRPRPGNFEIVYNDNNSKRKYQAFSTSTLAGVSKNDLPLKGSINRAAVFTYMDFKESEVKKFFKVLREHNPPILKPFLGNEFGDSNDTSNGDARYSIANKGLKDVITTCWAGMYANAAMRMEHTWSYLRWPSPLSGEADWYVSIVGNKRAVEFIEKVQKKRNQLNKKNKKEKLDITKYKEDMIKVYDRSIIHWYKEVMSKKYEKIRQRYSIIIDPLIETAYPKFLRELHKHNKI